MVCAIVAGVALPTACLVALAGDESGTMFSPSQLSTASGDRVDPDAYFEAGDCGECHPLQYEAWNGSVHSRAHEDSIYLAFAEKAREEGGDGLYTFCSSCHAPLGVAAGEIPGKTPEEKTFLTHEGVTCEACHTVNRIRTVHGEGGANASLVLEDGDVRFGPIRDPSDEASHESAFSDIHTQSTLCSACHTLVHPFNGLVIENTYEEWRQGPYAEAGIQCQDCHMRTVDQALEVASTRTPIIVPGPAASDGETRPDVHAHLFVGANTNEKLVGTGKQHTAMAVHRLQSAAVVDLHLPDHVEPAQPTDITIEIRNVSAGHAIPSSITELRQVWIDLAVADADGREIYRSGAVRSDGQVDPDAVMYHSVLVDENGEVTYLPWRAVKAVKERLIPAGGSTQETYTFSVPPGIGGPLTVHAVLRYRSAPQDVMDALFGKGRFPIEVVDMAAATGSIRVQGK